MKLPGSLTDTFSPYLDLDPVADFFEDLGQRAATVLGTAIGIHLALFFLLQPNFVMPDLKPDEPESIPVQIIAFEDLPAEAPPPEEEIVVQPVAPTPAPPPPPRPQPTPAPTPPPPPPEPVVEPEPEIAPPPPPPPEILAREEPEPTPEAVPLPTEIIPPPVPDPIPQPLPEPIIEIYEPAPVIQPVPEPLPEPIIEMFPEPVPEPELPPETIIEAPPPPDPQPGEWRPYVPPEPIVEPPAPEIITEEPLPELPDIETLPPIPTPEPEPVITQAPPAPEPIPEADAPIVTTAPTILASPEAPTTAREAEQAVPQSQSNPMNDFLFRGGKRPGSTPSTGIGQPSTGLGTPSGGRPVAGGTSRANPGASGWTLAPSGNSDLGAGYKGLVLDVRCREAGKSHLDCPEYLRRFQGRNRSGWESVGAHSSPAIVSTSPRAGTAGNPAVGSRDIWGSGPHSRPSALGSNSVNAGGPSTTVLDDADFGREFLGTNLGGGSSGQRMRDLFKEPDEPWQEEILTLPAPEPQDEDE